MDCYESLDSESGHPELEDEVPGKPILDDCLSPLAPRQDLPVVNLSSSKHKLWEIETPQVGRDSSKDYPTCILSACGRTWFILGLPIWNSVSLLGRGTSIWLVQENEVDPMFYLHDAGEGLILGEDQCLSACDRGSPLRSNSGEKERDVILHLSILKLHGRPINKHTTEKELLLGIRAAISAHKFLCDKGIPHRDINPNNIMLSVNCPSGTGTEGFLLDLDCAYIKRDPLDVPPARMPEADGSTATLAPLPHTTFGRVIWGTAQFIAVPILKAIIGETTVKHEPCHDLESFIYVLAYTLSERAVLELPQGIDRRFRDSLYHNAFIATFGRTSLERIHQSRGSGEPLALIHEFFPHLFSEPVVTLCQYLHGSLAESTEALKYSKRIKPTKLTHDVILSLLDEAIAKMHRKDHSTRRRIYLSPPRRFG